MKQIAEAETWGVALQCARQALRRTSSPTPELDAQLLLAHVLGVTRVAVLAYPERALRPEAAQSFTSLVKRRMNGEPVAYLTGHREFMGVDLLTDPRALIPRSETELLVEAALAEIRARLARTPDAPPLVAEIGTGSGAIAIAVAVHEPRVRHIYATDLSEKALELAASNVRRAHVERHISLLRGDLLDPLPERVDVLLANLPYIPDAEAPSLPRDVREHEPASSLFAGSDGLQFLRRFFAEVSDHTRPGAAVFAEFGAGQGAEVTALARAACPSADVGLGTDYAGWDRYAVVRMPT
jgi:release factor glutamine methyltransferase